MVVRPGSYSAITISQPLEVVGRGVSTAGGPSGAAIIDGGTSSDGISVESNDVRLSNLQARTAAGGFAANDAIRVPSSSDAVRNVDCTVSESDDVGIYVNGTRVIVRGVVVKGSIDGEEILLDSNSQSCVVDGNIPSVTDNGAANKVVGDNAG